MPADVNEIFGFVNSCTNAAWLRSLIKTADSRLQVLDHQERQRQAALPKPPTAAERKRRKTPEGSP